MIVRGSQKPARYPVPSGLPHGVILCGPGKPTAADIKAVTDFMAYLKARERAVSAYSEMVCGHFATKEVDDLYRCWRPKPGLHYCESCGKWQELVRIEKVEYPQTPLF